MRNSAIPRTQRRILSRSFIIVKVVDYWDPVYLLLFSFASRSHDVCGRLSLSSACKIWPLHRPVRHGVQPTRTGNATQPRHVVSADGENLPYFSRTRA